MDKCSWLNCVNFCFELLAAVALLQLIICKVYFNSVFCYLVNLLLIFILVANPLVLAVDKIVCEGPLSQLLWVRFWGPKIVARSCTRTYPGNGSHYYWYLWLFTGLVSGLRCVLELATIILDPQIALRDAVLCNGEIQYNIY